MSLYTYVKSPNNLDSLTVEIQASGITTALDYLYSEDTEIDCYFASDLSDSEKAILDTVIANHLGLPPL